MRMPCAVVLLVLALTLLSARPCQAQKRPIVFPPVDPVTTTTPVDPDAPSADDVSGLKTSVEFRILSGSPTAGLDSHRWVEGLQEFGVTVRVRTPKAGDKLGVTETVRGTLRWVAVTAELDERGQLRLPDRTVTLRQKTKLKEWINELKLYGAQGTPEGKPLWGMTYPQFNEVFKSLSGPVTNTIQGLPREAALQQLGLPAELPLRYHSTAKTHIAALPGDGPVRSQVRGLSAGTGLAVVLANYGLAYRPLRTPAGSMELVIEPLANLKQPWPMGWEPEKGASRAQMAPALFKMVPVGFDEVPVDDILGAVADVAMIPVVINYHSAGEKGIDLESPVNYPKKRAAYMMVLESVVRQSRLKSEFRVDERGVPFIYVTAFVPRTIKDLSPAESD